MHWCVTKGCNKLDKFDIASGTVEWGKNQLLSLYRGKLRWRLLPEEVFGRTLPGLFRYKLSIRWQGICTPIAHCCLSGCFVLFVFHFSPSPSGMRIKLHPTFGRGRPGADLLRFLQQKKKSDQPPRPPRHAPCLPRPRRRHRGRLGSRWGLRAEAAGTPHPFPFPSPALPGTARHTHRGVSLLAGAGARRKVWRWRRRRPPACRGAGRGGTRRGNGDRRNGGGQEGRGSAPQG